jgi:hypothetical protein
MTYARTINPKMFHEWEPGQLCLDIHVLGVNGFKLNVNDSSQLRVGVLSPAVGLTYSYRDNAHVSAMGGFARASNTPLAMDVERDSTRRVVGTASSWFINATNNHRWKMASLGYGLGISRNGYKNRVHYDMDKSKLDTVSRYINTGITVPVLLQFNIYKCINAGVMYQPMVYSFSRGFIYEHTVSMDVLIRIKLSRKNK